MRQPAPSDSLGSQPTAPRWVRLRSTVRPCSTMECDFLPLIWATKPTPQASCSLAGWYRPWGSFRITLGSDEWCFAGGGALLLRTSRGRVFDYTCVSLLPQVLRAALRSSNPRRCIRDTTQSLVVPRDTTQSLVPLALT